MSTPQKPRSFFPPDDQSPIAKWDRAMSALCDAPTFFGVERTLDPDREAGQEMRSLPIGTAQEGK